MNEKNNYVKESASAYMEDYDYGTAHEQFYDAIVVDPDSNLSPEQKRAFLDHMHRALNYYKVRKRPQAIADLNKAAQISPENPQPYFLSACLYYEEENYVRAVEGFKKACELAPGDIETQRFLAISYYRNGEYDKAIEMLKMALTINSGHADTHFNLARCYLDRGDYKEAVLAIDRAIEINPEKAVYYVVRGMVWISLNAYSLALDDFLKCQELGGSIEKRVMQFIQSEAAKEKLSGKAQ